MATDPRKRQKKLEKRAAKRKEKKHLQVREQNLGLADRLAAASKFPVLDCWIGEALWKEGIGVVLLSRSLPNGSVALANILVDRYCLGAKDGFGAILGRSAYDDKYVRQMRSKMSFRNASPADARKLVEEAVAYAHRLGLPPHPDAVRALPLFGDIDAAQSNAVYEFGKDGKPFFVAGPYDTPERCRQVLTTLTSTCGPDGFHYLLPLAGPDPARVLPESLQGRDVHLLRMDESEEAAFVDEEEE